MASHFVALAQNSSQLRVYLTGPAYARQESKGKIRLQQNGAPHMSKAPQKPAVVGGSADETEASFYEALQSGDIERLMACWADEDDVVCIHPGSPRLVGLGAVRAAFEMVLSHGAVRIQVESLRKIESMTSAVHSVRERIDILTSEGSVEAFAVATNVYFKTAQGWRMVAHHVSAGGPHDSEDISDPPHVLH